MVYQSSIENKLSFGHGIPVLYIDNKHSFGHGIPVLSIESKVTFGHGTAALSYPLIVSSPLVTIYQSMFSIGHCVPVLIY